MISNERSDIVQGLDQSENMQADTTLLSAYLRSEGGKDDVE